MSERRGLVWARHELNACPTGNVSGRVSLSYRNYSKQGKINFRGPLNPLVEPFVVWSSSPIIIWSYNVVHPVDYTNPKRSSYFFEGVSLPEAPMMIFSPAGSTKFMPCCMNSKSSIESNLTNDFLIKLTI